LTIATSFHAFASDHVPFLESDIPAALTIEGGDSANANIHTANDTVDKLDFDLAAEILRMNLAFTASAAEIDEEP
jgi:Zn-dependent M28 family amino/carboxypeptidase